MKKNLPFLFTIFCGIFLLQSCGKISPGTKNITLNETIHPGSIYALDISAYGGNSSTAVNTKQADQFTISQIDLDAAAGKNMYHFSSDTKLNENQTVVILVKAKDAGRCGHDENKMAISINFTVIQ
ncbi:MAG: hypothetical protein H7258_07955 [Ferruginibacter sp.]|nr:hypothetical protein [Ferruginibacter sp.]